MKTKNKKLVTHNGAFHADDVFACATLCLMLEEKGESYEIIRTRNDEIINAGDYVFDVGGIYDSRINRFDHHQPGGAGKRENGIEYSSFGLIWNNFGGLISGSEEIVKRVDQRLVQTIDAYDNGIDIYDPTLENISVYSIYDAIDSFHPSFQKIEENIDNAFLEVLAFAKTILQKEITRAHDQENIRAILDQAILKKEKDSAIIIAEEYIPRGGTWEEMVKHPEILFVVSPGNPQSNMWRVLALRDDLHSFKSRKDLPLTWGGLREEDLQKITEVDDAVFCHRGLFMVVAGSRAGAIKLAEMAVAF